MPRKGFGGLTPSEREAVGDGGDGVSESISKWDVFFFFFFKNKLLFYQ